MDEEESLKTILNVLAPHLGVQEDRKSGSITAMMCGVAAGKSTLSAAIVNTFPSFSRLSIDAIIADRHGIYNIDYPPSEYLAHLNEAKQVFLKQVHELLEQKKNFVLDSSFWAKKDRDEYKARIEHAGGRCILIYLKAERDVLWRRICERKKRGIDADSAREISPALLDQFVHGFEIPVGESEIVITVRGEPGDVEIQMA